MTGPSGTPYAGGAGHLDVEVLADLLAGEGSPDDVRHVGSCRRCSAALADLDAALVPVAAELAALAASPLPAPPPELEERLRAALAAEPVPSAAPAGPSRPVALGEGPGRARARGGGGGGGGAPVPRPAVRRPWLLSAAAAAAGVLVVVGLGVGLLRGGGSPDTQAGSARGGGEAASEAAPVPTASTGTTYRPDDGSVARALPGLLGQARETDRSGVPALASRVPGGADPLARLRDPDELAGCLSALGPGAPQPLAVDYAAFQDRPALLVVLPSRRAGKVDVYVVGAGCRAGDDQTLLFTRLDRPA